MKALDNQARRWSRPLRLLHLLLAIGVTVQLSIGSFMHSPRQGRPDSFGFETHEILGLTLLALVVLHWLWSLTHPNEGLRHLFPWTRAGLRRVLTEFWQAVRSTAIWRTGCRQWSGGLYPRSRIACGYRHGIDRLCFLFVTHGRSRPCRPRDHRRYPRHTCGNHLDLLEWASGRDRASQPFPSPDFHAHVQPAQLRVLHVIVRGYGCFTPWPRSTVSQCTPSRDTWIATSTSLGEL